MKRALRTWSVSTSDQQGGPSEEEGQSGAAAGGGDDWVLGPIRDDGSIHSDIWRGSAAALAERDAIGVFPISGWWKENPALQRWDRSARYALLVTIRAPSANIDIYTAIANQIAIPIPWRLSGDAFIELRPRSLGELRRTQIASRKRRAMMIYDGVGFPPASARRYLVLQASGNKR